MSWREVSIGELGRVVTGKTPPTGNREFYDGEYPFVTPTDLDWQSYIVRSTHSSVTELARDRNKNQFIPANSTVFTCIGNTIGKCGLSAVDCLTNQQINSIVPADEHDPKFIYYLLSYHRPQIRSLGLGNGAAQPIINKTTFSGVKVSVPATRDDEQRIATILSAYDELIENNRRRIALLEEAARQLYKEWFVRFRFPGHEHVKIIDGVPEGWSRKNLFDVATATYGHAFKSELFSNEPVGRPIVRIRDVPDRSSETWTTEDAPVEKILDNGDFLIGMDGDFHMNFWAGGTAWLNQRVVRLLGKEGLSTGLLRNSIEKQIKDLNETITGTTVKHLGAKHLKQIELLIPPSILLDQANEFCDSIRNMVVNLSVGNLQLAKTRDLLLPQLMSGAIAV